MKENGFVLAHNRYLLVGVLLKTEKQAHDIVLDVNRFMSGAMRNINSAREASGYAVWDAGGVWTEMCENNALVSREQHVRNVEILINQAQKI